MYNEKWTILDIIIKVLYKILRGGGGQDGRRMIVACESMRTCKRVCLLMASEGMHPLKNVEFRSSQIASGEIWDKIVV